MAKKKVTFEVIEKEDALVSGSNPWWVETTELKARRSLKRAVVIGPDVELVVRKVTVEIL